MPLKAGLPTKSTYIVLLKKLIHTYAKAQGKTIDFGATEMVFTTRIL